MPQINIFEKDISVTGVENLTTNIAYIPGYSIMGPVNEPTLCQTIDEFKNIFGTLPYKFRSTQDFPDKFDDNSKVNSKEALSGSYDKSYIYASELLLNGLPILFERVMKEEWIADWKCSADLSLSVVETTTNEGEEAKTNKELNSKLKITSKNPGLYGSYISYEVEANNKIIITLNKTKNSSSIGIPNTVVEEYTISFDDTSDNYYGKIESEIVDFSVTVEKGEKLNKDTILTPIIEKSYLSNNKTGDEFTLNSFYDLLDGYKVEGKETTITHESIFNKLSDKNTYNFKFLTSGSYPTFEYNRDNDNKNSIVETMLTVVGTRGDALALIDHTNKTDRALVDSNISLYECVNDLKEIIVNKESVQEDARKYGAMFTPWATYKATYLDGNYILPGSFAYLNSLAVSVQTNANWYAIAGVSRGLVPNFLQPQQVITGAIANKLQATTGISINPITNIRPYGYCIWGNRTLNKNNKDLIASSYLNIRSLANDVKKEVYKASNKLTFELNTDVLWLNFKASIEPMLDQMVSGNGLSDYKIIRKTSSKRATIEAVIRLYAIEAVENFDITIELSDSYVSVQ